MTLYEKNKVDKATIFTFKDGTLYYEEAMRMLSEEESLGIAIMRGLDIKGQQSFWVENGEAYPIIGHNTLNDYEYDDFKQNVLSQNEIDLIEKCFAILNDFLANGGN